MNLEGIRSDMSSPQTKSVEDNWTMLKEGIRSAIDVHIPFRMSKRKPDVPWMNVVLKRQISKQVFFIMCMKGVQVLPK